MWDDRKQSKKEYELEMEFLTNPSTTIHNILFFSDEESENRAIPNRVPGNSDNRVLFLMVMGIILDYKVKNPFLYVYIPEQKPDLLFHSKIKKII
jgi:hypothetical protein